MARGDPLYARLEVDFLESEKYLFLSPGARCLYLWLWCHCLKNRRQTIPRPSPHYMATRAGLYRHPISTYIRLMHDLGLLIADDTTINVMGVRDKHPQFQWKDSPNGERIGPVQNQSVPSERNVTERNGTERNVTKEKAPSGALAKKKKTNPDIKKFIDWYSQEHEKIMGSKLVIAGAKDSAAVKAMLGQLGIDELKVRASRYLADPRGWPEGDRSISKFRTQVNKYGGGKLKRPRNEYDDL